MPDKGLPDSEKSNPEISLDTPEKNPADPPKYHPEPIQKSPPAWFAKIGLRVKHKVLTSYFLQHLFVWVFISPILGAIFYGAGEGKVSYIDSLYMTVSAITATSLSAIDLSSASLGPRLAIFFFVTIGGAVFESIIPIVHRLWRTRGKRARHPKVARERTAVFRLLLVIACYFIGVQFLGFLAFGFYLQFSSAGAETMRSSGYNAWWFSLFHVCTSFQNAGFSLLPDSYMQFAQQPFPLLLIGALIMMGNVAYPVILRFIIFCLWRICRRCGLDEGAAIFKYILRQPRQCLTHLFPAPHTWVLFAMQMCYLVASPLIIMGLEWDGEAFETILPHANGVFKWLNSLFQVICVRTSGANSIPIAEMTGASLVLLTGFMYLSAYPKIIIMKTSNEELKESPQNSSEYHFKRMFTFDFMLIFLPWFLIAILEGPLDQTALFAVFFELVTAYGTVGTSIGSPTVNYSLSGTWSIPSKLIIIGIMLMGQHRSMPDDVDGALKDEFEDEDIDYDPPHVIVDPDLDLSKLPSAPPISFPQREIVEPEEVEKESHSEIETP